MASWKKVVVSGSAPELSNLQVDGLTASQVVIGGGSAGNLSTTAINGTGNILATTAATGVSMTGSFTGSFVGDGSGLSGVGTNAKFLVYQTGSGTDSIKPANAAGNTATGTRSTVAGGQGNDTVANCSFIGGGANNCVYGSSNHSSIAGGRGNRINNGRNSFLGSGDGNTISGNYSTLSGGYGNTVSSGYGVLGGGSDNTISGNYSTISSGYSNTVSGQFSGILGGRQNTVNTNCSFIIGSGINGTVANHTHVSNLTTAGNITGSAVSASGGVIASSAKVADLTSGRVVLAGTGGELEDNGNLTFNGSVLGVTGAITNASAVSATKLTGSFTGSFVGDGSGITGISSNTDVKDVYFVTPNGTDSTAQRGNLIKPYKTITAARSASVAAGNNSGSLVYVYPGEYKENSLNEGYAGSFYFAPEVHLIYSQSDGTNAPMFGAGFGAFPESIQVYGNASITSTDGDMLKMETSGAGYFECFDIKTSNNQIIYMENDTDLVFKADEIRISSPTYGFTVRDTAKFTLDAKVLDFTGTGGSSFCFFPRGGDSGEWGGEIDVNINKWILRDGYGVLQQNGNGSKNVYNIDNFVITESATWGLAFQSRNGTSNVSYVNFTSNIHCYNGARVVQDVSGTGAQEIILNGSLIHENGGAYSYVMSIGGGANTDIIVDMNMESSGSTEVISHTNGDLILGGTIVNESGDGVKTTGGKVFINNLNISASRDSVTSTGARTVTINNSLSSNVTASSNITFDGPGASLSPVSGRIIITDLSSSATSTSSFGTYRGGDNNTFGSTTLSSAAVSDLTATRVVFAGTGGELTDDSGLTFVAASDTLNVSDSISMIGNTGAITNASAVSATKLTGSFTGSFVGDGSGLTNLPASTLTVDGDSGTENVDLIADDLQIIGTSNEIETAASKVGNDVKITIGLPNDVTIGQDLTVTRDATITRNLIVQGTASFQHTTDLDIADRFIKMASGSTSNGSGGFAVQQTSATDSEALGWINSSVQRWGVTGSFDATNNTFTPDAFLSLAVVGGTGENDPNSDAPTKYAKAGNIFSADNGEIYIYS